MIAARLRPDDHRPDLGSDLAEVIERQAIRRTPPSRPSPTSRSTPREPPETLVASILAHADAVG